MLSFVPEGIPTRAGSMTELPFDDDFFDGAYATESLEHAVEIAQAVAEICRVGKPGGRIAIIDKNAREWGKLETPDWEKWFTRAPARPPLPRSLQPSDFVLGRRQAGRTVSGMAGGEIGADGPVGRGQYASPRLSIPRTRISQVVRVRGKSFRQCAAKLNFEATSRILQRVRKPKWKSRLSLNRRRFRGKETRSGAAYDHENLRIVPPR